MPDRPVEILALPPKLHALFDGHVPQKTNGDAEQLERDFLSRALSAFTAHRLGGASIADAAISVVDGGGDGGIDGVYFSPATNTLWLVQAKYIHAGLTEPDLGDVTKFNAGVEYLLAGNFKAFAANPHWVKILPQIETHLKNASTRVRAVLCYSGLALISEDRKRLFEALKKKVSKDADDDFFQFHSINLTTLNDWVTGGGEALGVDTVDLEIICPGLITKPHETIYGLVSLERLDALHRAHGKRLVAANLRGFKGRTDVNEEIQKTISEEADLFFYLNNGLTAYCDRLELNNLDRTNAEKKRITAKGFAIINGAQTLGSIVKCFDGAKADAKPTGFAFIKIISLEKCEDDRVFADRISRTANFQNHVGLKDFAGAYEFHEQVFRTLQPHKVDYHYKIDEDTPDNDQDNFNMEEALTACACLKNTNDCDLVTRVAANRDSLRSLEMVFPAEELLRSRHEHVFPPNLSARSVWRAVQSQRIVLQVIQDTARASMGASKSFFGNARWVVLAAIFNRLKPEEGEALTLSAEEKAALAAAVTDYAEKLLAISVAKGFASYEVAPGGVQTLRSPRDFQSVFKTQGDCKILLDALKAEIWTTPNTTQAQAGSAAGQ
ncbi:MAG TPA: AIPR family protein [Alphaproteobacteria bacterium]|jgi:hypothetical protein